MSESDTRLQSLFGSAASARFVERLRHKLERGAPLVGTVTLADASDEEKQHFASIFGTAKTHSLTLRVNLDELTALLRKAGIADDLQQAIERLIGPVPNVRAVKNARDSEWSRIHERLEKIAKKDVRLLPWVEMMRGRGLLRRLARNSPQQADQWIDGFERVWSLLPLRGMPLARLAADSLGDAHALDAGQTLPAIILRAVPLIGEALPEEDLFPAERRRELWAAGGVLSGELSGAILVLNLPAEPSNSTGMLLCTAADAGEPLYLTLRQLLRTPPIFREGQNRTIFVCENPTVLASAANELGERCAPLVCVLGHLRQSAHRLLRQLTNAHYRIRYHGDFDWAGITIANSVVSRHQAIPWRMGATDYLNAPLSNVPLGKNRVAAGWDKLLMSAMVSRAHAVFEEQVLDGLIQDLALGAESEMNGE